MATIKKLLIIICVNVISCVLIESVMWTSLCIPQGKKGKIVFMQQASNTSLGTSAL